MSRNLSHTDCYFCLHTPVPVEAPQPAKTYTNDDYYHNRAHYFMRAECCCGATYLAWCGRSHQEHCLTADPKEFFDLSFFHSFSDEPAMADLPIYRVDQFGERVGVIEDAQAETMSHWPTRWRRHLDDDDLRDIELWKARRDRARQHPDQHAAELAGDD